MAIQKLFPSLFLESSLTQKLSRKFINDLRNESYLFMQQDQLGQAWSKKNYLRGYTSYSSMTNLNQYSSRFDHVKKIIDKEVLKMIKAMDLDLCGGKIELSSMWINIMGKGCSHSFHLHPHSVISGTFYIHVPKGSGDFVIEDPRLARMMALPPRLSKAKRENKNFIQIKPESGKLILFESWINHEVRANQSSDERISLSFNYDWYRK
jgi:uncharacterized protein (TIGR02466 family)